MTKASTTTAAISAADIFLRRAAAHPCSQASLKAGLISDLEKSGNGKTQKMSALSVEQARKITLFLTTSGLGDAIEHPVSVAALLSHEGVSEPLLTAVDVVPAALLHANATLEGMLALGYDSKYCAENPSSVSALARKFGELEVAVALLKTPNDAKVLVGTFCSTKLNLTPRMLITACEDDRNAALEVVDGLLNTTLKQSNDCDLSQLCEPLSRLGITGEMVCNYSQLQPELLVALLQATKSDLELISIFT